MFLEIWELLKKTSDLHIDKNINDLECHILFGLMYLKGRRFFDWKEFNFAESMIFINFVGIYFCGSSNLKEKFYVCSY